MKSVFKTELIYLNHSINQFFKGRKKESGGFGDVVPNPALSCA